MPFNGWVCKLLYISNEKRQTFDICINLSESQSIILQEEFF